MPLGTGNDMARVLGWGGQSTDEEKIPQILAEMEQSSFKLLDRWSLYYSSSPNIDVSHLLGSHGVSALILTARVLSIAYLCYLCVASCTYLILELRQLSLQQRHYLMILSDHYYVYCKSVKARSFSYIPYLTEDG